MKRIFKATINFDTKNNHPDEKNVQGMSYDDTYTVDTDYFESYEDAKSYIKHDLALVAGGGYETSTIKNVKYSILEV
jgi:hypothetical protein